MLTVTCAGVLVGATGQTAYSKPSKGKTKTVAWHLGKWEPGYHNVINAIYYEFCGHKYRYCWLGSQAKSVAGCESRYSIWASNGQYLGIFQLGSHERATYGHGNNPWAQARGAHNYYVAANGWGPWECK